MACLRTPGDSAPYVGKGEATRGTFNLICLPGQHLGHPNVDLATPSFRY